MADLTLEQAAATLGLSPDTLRSQLRYGRLKGRKVGPVWTVSTREVERYRRESRRKMKEHTHRFDGGELCACGATIPA